MTLNYNVTVNNNSNSKYNYSLKPRSFGHDILHPSSYD